jgi:hypothetical protein
MPTVRYVIRTIVFFLIILLASLSRDAVKKEVLRSNTSTSIAQANEKRNQPIGCVSNVTETTDYRLEIHCIVNLVFSYSKDKKLVYFPESKFKICVVKTQKPIFFFLLASLKKMLINFSCIHMMYFLPTKI